VQERSESRRIGEFLMLCGSAWNLCFRYGSDGAVIRGVSHWNGDK